MLCSARDLVELEEVLMHCVTELAHIGVSHDWGLAWDSISSSQADTGVASGLKQQVNASGSVTAQMQAASNVYLKYAKVRHN